MFNSKDIIILKKGKKEIFYRLDLMYEDKIINSEEPRYRMRITDDRFYLTMKNINILCNQISNSDKVMIRYNDCNYELKTRFDIYDYAVYLFREV